MMMTTLLWALLTLVQGVIAIQWEVNAPTNVMAAVGTCIRIPCSFSHPAGSQLKTVQWLKNDKRDGILIVSSPESPDPLHHPRAKIPEHWQTDKDCTLTIDSLTKRDKGWYYFRMENERGEKYSGPDGVLLNISDESSLLTISSPEETTEGHEVVLTCSVKFACPGHLRWRGMDGLDPVSGTETPGSAENSWTTSLTLSFVASYQDHGRSLTCVHSPGESTGKNVTLIINYAPRSVLLTLSPDTFSPGASSLSLRCTVGSSNPPVTSYRWHQTRYGSSQTTGTWTSTHKINQLTKDTDYWCEAINSVGPTTSEKTKLPVYGGYGWAVWTPVSVRAHVGSCVIIPCRFRVRRTARAPWIGIWLKDHNFSGTRVYSTSGESGADYKRRVHFLGSMEDQNCSLKIQNLGLSDSGKYFFRLEGPDKWSDPIGVNLLVSGEPEAPEISDPGQVVEGTSVSLTCSLHSYCADDVPLLLWQPPPHLPAVPRIIYRDQHWIHSSEVEFMPSSDERQRAVSCEATFAIGTSSVRTVRALDVKYPPRNVTVSLRVNGWINRSLSEGARVLLSCSSTSADPPVQSYTWYRNGVEIYWKNSHDLEFPSISYVDFGKYACQASNAVGSSRTEEVTVTGKHKPQGVHIESRVNGVEVGGTVNVKMNDRLSLACVSRVSDPPVNSYSWKSNGFVYRQRDQTLVFDRITQQQAGRYLCTSGNGIGTVSSETITVNVQYAPINVRITAPTAPPAGEYITLRCGSHANPAVNSYSWRKLCGSQSTDLWGNRVAYRLRATVEAGTCDYFCTARNYLGLKESSAQRINVQYAPINVRITAPTASPAGEYTTLRCESQANPVVNTYSWRTLCGSQSTDLRGYGVEYKLRATVEVGTCDYFCTARNYLGLKESPAQRINVQWSKQRKIIAGVRLILVLLLLIIPLVFYIRHRRKKVDSQSAINTDAMNVVYSVVKKTRKPGGSEDYENVTGLSGQQEWDSEGRG